MPQSSLAATPGAGPRPGGGWARPPSEVTPRRRPARGAFGATLGAVAVEPAEYQSLYRRYRPQRFADVLGQDHVTRALRNAVREGRVGHGYLFSGPRGTGKTSTARILAKALNCEKLDDGEPCGTCDSCLAVQSGTSFAVIELDAASNNGVDAMRDLISRAALGTAGLRKVYIVDEVHMLSTAAANTLLKTLEEPPRHVVFVLATTDPQKVLPTIRSRVQHFEFHLLGADVLAGLVKAVNADAGLALTDDDLDRVVRRGSGSARDVLSALDQAAVLGGAEDEVPVAAEVAEALCERETSRALAAVAAGVAAGRDPRRLAEEVLAHLRDAFLASRAPSLVDRPAAEVGALADQAIRLGTAATVRAMETVGTALADMRDALDPRITLEVALVRLTAPEADTSPGALVERIERLERRLAASAATNPVPAGTVAAPAPPTPAPAPPLPVPAPAPPPARPAPGPPPPGRGALGSYRNDAAAGRSSPPPPRHHTEGRPPDGDPEVAAPPEPPGVVPPPVGDAAGRLPSRDELTKAWGDSVLPGLRGRAKALYMVGRFVAVTDGVAEFALPNATHRDQCRPLQADVEAALAAHFARSVPLRLVVDAPPPASPSAPDPSDDEEISLDDLRDAPAEPASLADRLKSAFPGAEEVEL